MATPMFSSHHSPVGAWASLVFGKAGAGIKIEHEGCGKSCDFLVGVQRDGVTTGLPFSENAPTGWKTVGEQDVRREVSPCVDEFVCESAGLTLRVYTPHAALPNPKRSGSLQYSTVPGVLMEVVIDNSNSDAPAVGFVGLSGKGHGSLRPVDWSSKTLCGVGNGGKWILATPAVKGETYTVLANGAAEKFGQGGAIETGATAGGIAIHVAARSTKTVNVVFAFYHSGAATQGIEGRYLYTAYFPKAEAVANFMLTNSQKLRESCTHFDGRIKAATGEGAKLAALSHGLRNYDAHTQVTDAENNAYFTAIDQWGYRNSLLVNVDHLAWELYRNPWVVRNVFDLGTTSYSYHDKIKFAGEGEELREGGLTFVHDYGYQTSYTPNGTGAFTEMAMATEQLLDGIYMLTSYALLADDTPWAKTRLPFARDLLVSMENRDHWDPEKRTGILKADTQAGVEATGLAALGKELGGVSGNLYVAIKTFCANMLLTTYFQNNNDLHSADYSYAFAQKTAAAITAGFDAGSGLLPANLISGGNGVAFIGALEPLALPTYLGLTSTLAEYFPELFNALKSHAVTCLKSCVAADGGLKLASTSDAVVPSKVIGVLFVLERLFGIDVQAEYPTLWQSVERGAATSADGLIAAALFVKPAVTAQA